MRIRPWRIRAVLSLAFLAATLALPSAGHAFLLWLDSPSGRNNPNDPRSLRHHLPTNTPQGTRTASPTHTDLPTGTPSASATAGAASPTPSPSAISATAMPTPTATRLNTELPTGTASATLAASASPTPTPSASGSTSTNVPSLTATASPSGLDTKTASPAASLTPSVLATLTLTPVATASPSSLATRTASPAATSTPSALATKTATPAGTFTPSALVSLTLTGLATASPSGQPTKTASPLATLANTVLATQTATPSAQANTSVSPTRSGTATQTNTALPSATGTSTSTANASASPTVTATKTASPTATASATATRAGSPSATATPSRTATQPASPTAGPSNTPGPPTCASVPAWNPNSVAYSAGMQISYNGSLYQCLQAHTSQAAWDPADVASLWTLLGPCSSASATASPTSSPAGTATVSSSPSPVLSPTPSPTASPAYSPTRTPTVSPSFTRSATPLPTATPGNKRFVGYFAQWGVYARSFFVKNVDSTGEAAKLTHIIYAFSNIQNNLPVVGVNQAGVGDSWADYQMGYTAANSVDGVADVWNQPLKGNWNQLKKLKAKYPNLKVLMALGGWTWTDGFYSAAQPANRVAFVAACIDAFIRGNIPYDAGSSTGGTGAAAGVFDGIDLDWEYPGSCGNTPGCPASAADTANYTALVAEFRKQLDAVRPGLELALAVPAGSDKISAIDIAGVAANVDFVDLMTYDFFGAWAAQGPTALQAALYAWPGMPTSGAQANYYADYAVQAWKAGGMPAAKIDLGIPYYGRGWTGVAPTNNGLNQPATAAAPCSGFTGCEAGITDYKVLAGLGAPKFYTGGTAWTYDGTQFWSFDDATTVGTKTCYINAQGLGGALVWSLDGDDGTLSAAVANGLQSGACGPTPTPAGSPTRTATNTPVHSPTATTTPSRTATASPSFTRTPALAATATPSRTATPAPTSTPGAGLPKHILTGYWHNFDNGLTPFIQLDAVSTKWDVLDVSFGDTAADYATVSFTPYLATPAQFAAKVAYLHTLNKKVVLSLGGQNGVVILGNAAATTAFVNSVESVIDQYGFDGLDLDIETGVSLDAGDGNFKSPTTPALVNLISAVHSICAHYGPNFILSMAPQVANVQGGITAYANIWGAYLPLIYGLRDVLTCLQVQYYNCGGNAALDGANYNQGTADFEVAMTDMLLQGFPIAGNASNMFPPLRPDQVMPGIPAAVGAAPSGGYLSPAGMTKALNYLYKGQSYGGAYVMRGSSYPDMRGLMTWSVNWDAQNTYEFTNSYRPYLDALP